MNKRNLILFLLWLLSITMLVAQTNSTIGNFSVQSGDGKITVIFYETKDIKELNRPAKDQLNSLFFSIEENDRRNIVRLSVIDCTSAFRPFLGIWKNQLVENSELEGVDVFGDWDGQMKESFSFETDEPYLVIMDQKGSILFFESGPLTQTQIDDAEEILLSLFTDAEND